MNLDESILLSDELFGFRKGDSGGHTSRSMMLSEIELLLSLSETHASRKDYNLAIIEANLLDKPTESSRVKSNRIITDLYDLDANRTLFRCFRSLYQHSPAALPQLALVHTFCRDALLRASSELIFNTLPGQTIPRSEMEDHFETCFPGRFSEAMKKSLSQNVNTSWTAAGHLTGRSIKTRSIPPLQPVAATFAMLAATLLGITGSAALDSPFARLVSMDSSALSQALIDANAQNLCDFRQSGGVVEIRFPQLLSSTETSLIHV